MMREQFENTGLTEKAGNFETNIGMPDYLPGGAEQDFSGDYRFDDTGWDEPTQKITYESYDGEI